MLDLRIYLVLVLQVAGETGHHFIKQWGKQSISMATQKGMPLFPPSSHFVSFTVAWSVHDSHMTNVECVSDLFPFCITYEFDLHSRAVLISQSSSNHCILLKNMHTIILPQAVL